MQGHKYLIKKWKMSFNDDIRDNPKSPCFSIRAKSRHQEN